MKKLKKNKIGFTLIEMVLVIAIIVILAAVVALSVGGYLNRAKNAASSIDSHNDAIESARDRVDAELER
jgi:type IV pilus assembly protein PilA